MFSKGLRIVFDVPGFITTFFFTVTENYSYKTFTNVRDLMTRKRNYFVDILQHANLFSVRLNLIFQHNSTLNCVFYMTRRQYAPTLNLRHNTKWLIWTHCGILLTSAAQS